MNDTTRMYPREMGHHKPEQMSIFGPYTPQKKSSGQLEFWVCLAISFFCGFFIKSFWS